MHKIKSVAPESALNSALYLQVSVSSHVLQKGKKNIKLAQDPVRTLARFIS